MSVPAANLAAKGLGQSPASLFSLSALCFRQNSSCGRSHGLGADDITKDYTGYDTGRDYLAHCSWTCIEKSLPISTGHPLQCL